MEAPARAGAVHPIFDEVGHRLRELRGSVPVEVVVTAPGHPLAGLRLVVDGHRRVGGVPCLIVRLPDGTPGTVALADTSAGASGSSRCGVALLSAEGVRRVRVLVGRVLADRSGT